MTITLHPNPNSQWIEDLVNGLNHDREAAVFDDETGFEFYFDVRDLIHWVAYQLETGREGFIGEHLCAAVLRSLCEEFYPFWDYPFDEREELEPLSETEGVSAYSEPVLPKIDMRLLELQEGFVVYQSWLPYSRVEEGAAEFVEVLFPQRAFERFGIRGLRVASYGLLTWLADKRAAYAGSHRPRSVWLPEMFARFREANALDEQRYADMCAGLDAIERTRASTMTADDVLNELQAMVN